VKLKSPLAIGAWSLVSTACIRQWMATLDCRCEFGAAEADPVHPGFRGAKIFVFWHENILLPLFLRGHGNISMLLSRHGDADILARVAHMMGFGTVRGSTFQGGSAALRELAERAGSPSRVRGAGPGASSAGRWPFPPTSIATASSGTAPGWSGCSAICPTRPRRGPPPVAVGPARRECARNRRGWPVGLRPCPVRWVCRSTTNSPGTVCRRPASPVVPKRPPPDRRPPLLSAQSAGR